MGLFRRRETLNEKLLREAGLDPAQALGASTSAPHEVAAQKLVRPRLPDGSSVDPREWDAAVTVTASGLAGSRIEFTTLPNGDLIVGEETGDADLSPLADAVEQHVRPPYRAVAQRQGGGVWAVAAKRVEVAQIPFPDADKLALSRTGEAEELRVDEEPSDEPVPAELERLGVGAGNSFYVEAERIDGDLWEVRATAL
ncbi:MAG TPA: hypothetical protein VE984_00545 [Gaiellaceae bacterium]|nr:hypothetical protein [Gaiellaceae bacterium]